MIRYTSDPVTNLDIMYKTMASVSADPNIDTSNLNIPDNDVAPSTDNQIDVPYNTVLRLPDSDPYNQLIKGFDNTVEKYNDKIHQIKSLEEKLNRLKEERAKYISQRQEKRDYYNSEGFLAKVYKYDPKTAEYLANRKQAGIDKTLREQMLDNKIDLASMRLNDNNGVYTPEQKQLIDAKNENRLQMQKAQSSLNTAMANNDKTNYEYWKKQVDAYKDNDVRLNNSLAQSGLASYVSIPNDTTDKTKEPSEEATKLGDGTTDTTKDTTKDPYKEATKLVDDALAIDKSGYTTKANKDKALNALLGYNASLGKWKLEDSQLEALKTKIKTANVRPVVSRPKTTEKETRDYALNKLADLIKWSLASKLDPKNQSERLLLAKIKSRGYANEAYMSDDAELSSERVMKFINAITNFRELPEQDGINFKNEIPGYYNTALDAVRMYLSKDYISTVSKALYDNIENTIKNYPLHMEGGSTPNANNKGTTKIGKFTVKKRSN